MVVRDSSNGDHDVTLIQLGPKIRLTSYSGEYYLNLQTPFGWEFLKIEERNRAEYLNIIPFYFTSYNDQTGDVNVFLKSTATIYPNLKPVYNSEHLIVGVKGTTDPKAVKEAFKLADIPIIWKGARGTIHECGVNQLNGKVLVKVDPTYYRPTEVMALIGNPAKAKNQLGWEALVKFKELVRIMLEADILNLENQLK